MTSNQVETRPAEAEDLKILLQRMDFHAVERLADAIERLGTSAVAELRALGEYKHRRAIWDGRAYIRPDVALEIDAICAICEGLNLYGHPATKVRASKRG